jgi:hypothetical protein
MFRRGLIIQYYSYNNAQSRCSLSPPLSLSLSLVSFFFSLKARARDSSARSAFRASRNSALPTSAADRPTAAREREEQKGGGRRRAWRTAAGAGEGCDRAARGRGHARVRERDDLRGCEFRPVVQLSRPLARSEGAHGGLAARVSLRRLCAAHAILTRRVRAHLRAPLVARNTRGEHAHALPAAGAKHTSLRLLPDAPRSSCRKCPVRRRVTSLMRTRVIRARALRNAPLRDPSTN